MRVGRINAAQLRRVASSQPVIARERQVAEQIARLAAAEAPKRTGRGAASIHAEAVPDQASGGTAFRVGWDRRRFYLFFQNGGTRALRARRFMEHATDRVRGR